jgi:hypothetical protein
MNAYDHEGFFMAKDFCTHTTNFLRQEKILRDHGSELASLM